MTTTDDLLDDIQGMTEHALRTATEFPPHEGIKLESVDVEVERLFTVPECYRKAVSVGLRLEIQVDGEDADDNCDQVKAALRRVAERLS